MVSKTTIFVVLIIVLGVGWAVREFSVIDVGNIIPSESDSVPVTSQRPKCADSYILVDFNDLLSFTNITIEPFSKVRGMLSREEMNKYRFTMMVGEVYLLHTNLRLSDLTEYTEEYRYLGKGVLQRIYRYSDPDYVKEYEYRMSVGGGTFSGSFTFLDDGPVGDRRINAVVYEVLPKIIVFKVTQIWDEHYLVGRWWGYS